MRREPVILVLVLGIAAAASWFLARQASTGQAEPQAIPGANEAADSITVDAAPKAKPVHEAQPELAIAAHQGTRDSGEGTGETPEEKKEAYVARRVAELLDLGMEDDPASLATILSELNNQDPGIREAAVEAAVQFGSQEAIPRLLEAAAQTDDPNEKSAILEAVEFLKLPTLDKALRDQTRPLPDASADRKSNP
jgi:hypothetical protein